MENKLAVEWFANRISHGGLVSKKQFNELLEQAKQMEKEQMRSDFWHHRRITGYEILKDEVITFKQQEQ